MRLINCYISGFGALSDYSLDFGSGVTCVLEQNGFGKTTLSAFIKAMFYGMKTARKGSSADKSDRVKYYPWNNTNFGGQIVFSLGSKTYRVIRSFDRLSPTRDYFKLVDEQTGKESFDFSENIGEEIFKIDEEGFVKTTFSNGNVNLDGLPSGVRAKISSNVNVADDMDGYEKAYSKLLSAAKAIEGRNKLLDSARDMVQNARTKSERLKEDVREYSRLLERLSLLEERLKKAQKTENELFEKQKKAASVKATQIRKQQYQKLLEGAEQAEQEMLSILKKYSGSLPSEEQICDLEAAVFDNNELKILLNAEKIKPDLHQQSRLFAAFKESLPTDEQIKEAENNLADLEFCKKRLGERSKRGTAYLLSMIFALLAVLGGVVCAFNLAVGAALGAVGVVAAFVCFAVSSKGKNERKKLEKDMQTVQNSLYDFVKGYLSEFDDIKGAIYEIKTQREVYVNALLSSEKKVQEYVSGLEKNTELLSEILDKIGYCGQNAQNYQALLDEIKIDKQRYSEKKALFLKYKAEKNEIEAQGEVENEPYQNLDSLEKINADIEENSLERRRIEDEINSTKTSINLYSRAQESLNEQQEIIDNESANIEQYEYNLGIIKKTAQILESAKDALSKKYSRGILEAFEKYSAAFLLGENEAVIDPELKLSLKQGGIARDANLFSEGQQSIMDVCLRLSLVDAMFELERPFIVLDDPFASMDDENFKKAAELIKKVAENTQVVYFTCHTSRQI